MTDFVANFELEQNNFDADFELDTVQFDALFEINPTGATWGGITGTLSEQTDLINLLNDKVDVSDFTTLSQTVTNNSNNITLLQNAVNSYGDIVAYDAADFATKEQGLLAESALQPGDNITELNNNAGYITAADLPTVNNNTITIQKNGTNIDSFTLNQNTNKSINITVPTNTNELTNGAGFITSAVNNLTNYYLKSETYTKTEVQQLIASIPQFSVEVVQSLPVTGERMVLYLVPKQGEQPDVYDEYIWVEDENEFELLGSTAVDLTGYAKESWVLNQGYITSSALNGYATETYVNNGLATKQNTLVSGTNIKTINNETVLGSGNIDIQSSTVAYGTSITAGNVAEKEVSIPEITELNVGQILYIKPSASATVANLTIKLNNFTAYPIRYNNSAITTSTDDLVWGQNFVSQFIFDGTYWQFAGRGYDNNTTYTLNTLFDRGSFVSGSGTYAITRYSLCLQKPDMTWEKITNTEEDYSLATNKTVNTHGFLLNNEMLYYSNAKALANGAVSASNTMYRQNSGFDIRYSMNTTGTGYTAGDYIYLVGTIGVDGLFYLDSTQWWTNTLPSTNDGKIYVKVGKYVSGVTVTLELEHPAYYHDGTKICVYQSAGNKQDTLVSGTNIKTINNQSLLGNGNITISGGGAVDSVNGQTGVVVLTASDVGALPDSTTIPTMTSQLANDSGFITNSALSGYATESWVGNQGYITGITSSDVTTALGYTPYNATNPNGYTSNVGTVTSVNNTQPDINGNVTITIPDTATWGNITGTLSDQTDLQNALNAKLNVSDVTEYTAAEVETLWGSI